MFPKIKKNKNKIIYLLYLKYLLLFPKTPEEGKQFYYSCSHLKNYKYAGLMDNTLSNSEQFPYLPCCYEANQKVQNKLRFMYEKDIEVEDKEGFKQVIRSKKVLKPGQYGLLSDNILHLFNNFNSYIYCKIII